MECCQSVSISATGPAGVEQQTRMGHFNFHHLDSNENPVYKNSNDEYLFTCPPLGSDQYPKWMVSYI